jgi:nucleoid-associated protein YgaU
VRMVKLGDTLPQLCHLIYGDPRYYLQIADRNGLANFRILTPGLTLKFPPIAKTSTAGTTTGGST